LLGGLRFFLPVNEREAAVGVGFAAFARAEGFVSALVGFVGFTHGLRIGR
jgi:hypothetical protein